MIALLAQAETGSGGALSGLLFPVLMIAVFYLLLIRPQQRKAKAQQALVRSVAVGDRVITIGGVHATVMSVDEDTMRLEIAPGTVITMARTAVARKLVDADAPSDGV
ncbi:MAG TPA: preprotein translocase subunit YajC [Egibacteraceae bacterium]|nr:preprotein translocase subunit YajC [Egibacteraceae bacterium]